MAFLFLAAVAIHDTHGHEQRCPLCDAAPHPEPFAIVVLLQAERPVCSQHSAADADIDLTLAEVASSISFRGPPDHAISV